MKKYLSLFALAMVCFSQAQQKGQLRRVATVAFYNVENIWDTIQSADYIDGTKDFKNPAFHRSVPIDSIKHLPVDGEYKGVWDNESVKGKRYVKYQGGSHEFTSKSPKNYNSKVYQTKLDNASKVISEIGFKYTNSAPTIVGISEIENKKVMEDLISQPALAKYNYGIIHFNSYDYRGIDIGLIYQKRRFTPSNSLKREIPIFGEDGKREYTRHILVVTGMLDNEKVAFFVNHWPSRRGGEAISLPKRNAAAAILKKEMDSVLALDPSTKLIAMGDFNDDPNSPSLKNILKAAYYPKDVSAETPYLNLMYPLYKKGVASNAYQDSPNLFDQLIASGNLVNKGEITNEFSIFKTEVYAPAYLITKTGNYKGYPFRSWSGDKFTGGYSDHFPVFTILQKLP